MERQGKLTTKTKFPRVIKNQAWNNWEDYIREKMMVYSLNNGYIILITFPTLFITFTQEHFFYLIQIS
jgi:hypothetical protein